MKNLFAGALLSLGLSIAWFGINYLDKAPNPDVFVGGVFVIIGAVMSALGFAIANAAITKPEPFGYHPYRYLGIPCDSRRR